MSVFCGCFKTNANTHVSGGNAPGKNPSRDPRRRSGANNGAENAMLEMNRGGAAGDGDYPMETDDYAGFSADRSQSPKLGGGFGRGTNGTYDKISNSQSHNNMTMSRYDDSKVSFVSVGFHFLIIIIFITLYS